MVNSAGMELKRYLDETNFVAICVMWHDNRAGQLSHLATRDVNKS